MKLVDAASNAIGSAMAYTIGIYNTDANRRGKISFTSYQELPAGYQLVAPGADLTTLMTGTNVVLILAPGETYTLPSKYAFPETAETIEIRGAYGTMPTLNTIGNLSMSVAAKSIKFSNLKLVGGGIGGDYIFNENTSTTRGLKDFILDGCDISNYRGLNRVRGASYALNNFTINNCVIHDIGTYNIYQGEGASVANITITNTTFNHLEDRFLYFKTPGLVSIKIANCTFYNAIKSTRYLADFNADPANAPTGSFEVSDCIFSKFFGGPWDGTATVKFTNPSGTIANVVRSYVTTDFVTAEPYGTADTYNGTADALFTDPATGNFLIKDKNFPGAKSAGDPRWYMK
jgi:ABC-type amino acid transport substrate-binding protein